MSSSQWYFSHNGKESGPVTTAELKRLADRGDLGPEDLVWREGWVQRYAARTVKGLFAASTAASPPEYHRQPRGAAGATPFAGASSSPPPAGKRPDPFDDTNDDPTVDWRAVAGALFSRQREARKLLARRHVADTLWYAGTVVFAVLLMMLLAVISDLRDTIREARFMNQNQRGRGRPRY
jgi:hypothetical protein